MKKTALQTFEPDLDLLQVYAEELSHLSSEIQYINQDLDKTVDQLQNQAGVDEKYPLPNANEEPTAVAASKFSVANNRGLRKVQRAASKLSFAQHEMEESHPIHLFTDFNYTGSTPAHECPAGILSALGKHQYDNAEEGVTHTFTALDPQKQLAFSQKYTKHPGGGASWKHMYKHEPGQTNPDSPSYDDLIKLIPGSLAPDGQPWMTREPNRQTPHAENGWQHHYPQ